MCNRIFYSIVILVILSFCYSLMALPARVHTTENCVPCLQMKDSYGNWQDTLIFGVKTSNRYANFIVKDTSATPDQYKNIHTFYRDYYGVNSFMTSRSGDDLTEYSDLINEIDRLDASCVVGNVNTNDYAEEVYFGRNAGYGYHEVLSNLALNGFRWGSDIPLKSSGIDIVYSQDTVYMADGASGLYIFNVNDPSDPELFDTYSSSNAKAVFKEDDKNYIYLADSLEGLEIIRIHHPTEPTRNFEKIGNFNPDIANNVFVSGNYAYLADGANGLRIIDISTPSEPEQVGILNQLINKANDVCISGNYAFVADGTNGIRAVDISTPSNPTLGDTYDTPGSALGVFASGDYLYVADSSNGLVILDISDPEDMGLEGSYNTAGIAKNLWKSGPYAFIADGLNGLLVIDVGTPSSPSLLQTFDTEGDAKDVHARNGLRGITLFIANGSGGLKIASYTYDYPLFDLGTLNTGSDASSVFFDGDYVFISDASNGILKVDISSPGSPSLEDQYSEMKEAKSVFFVPSTDILYGTNGEVGLSIIDASSDLELEATFYTADNFVDVYVDVDQDYAYIADKSIGLRIIDVSDPSDPSQVAIVNSNTGAEDIFVLDTVAFMVEGANGVTIIDVKNPDSPVLKGNFSDSDEASGVYAFGIGNVPYACIADGSNGLWIIEASNLDNPTEVSNTSTAGSSADAIFIEGDYAYIVDGTTGHGLEKYDISDRSDPDFEGALNTSGYARDVDVNGDYAFVADDLCGLRIINIDTSPFTEVGSYLPDRKYDYSGDMIPIIDSLGIKWGDREANRKIIDPQSELRWVTEFEFPDGTDFDACTLTYAHPRSFDIQGTGLKKIGSQKRARPRVAMIVKSFYADGSDDKMTFKFHYLLTGNSEEYDIYLKLYSYPPGSFHPEFPAEGMYGDTLKLSLHNEHSFIKTTPYDARADTHYFKVEPGPITIEDNEWEMIHLDMPSLFEYDKGQTPPWFAPSGITGIYADTWGLGFKSEWGDPSVPATYGKNLCDLRNLKITGEHFAIEKMVFIQDPDTHWNRYLKDIIDLLDDKAESGQDVAWGFRYGNEIDYDRLRYGFQWGACFLDNNLGYGKSEMLTRGEHLLERCLLYIDTLEYLEGPLLSVPCMSSPKFLGFDSILGSWDGFSSTFDIGRGGSISGTPSHAQEIGIVDEALNHSKPILAEPHFFADNHSNEGKGRYTMSPYEAIYQYATSLIHGSRIIYFQTDLIGGRSLFNATETHRYMKENDLHKPLFLPQCNEIMEVTTGSIGSATRNDTYHCFKEDCLQEMTYFNGPLSPTSRFTNPDDHPYDWWWSDDNPERYDVFENDINYTLHRKAEGVVERTDIPYAEYYLYVVNDNSIYPGEDGTYDWDEVGEEKIFANFISDSFQYFIVEDVSPIKDTTLEDFDFLPECTFEDTDVEVPWGPASEEDITDIEFSHGYTGTEGPWHVNDAGAETWIEHPNATHCMAEPFFVDSLYPMEVRMYHLQLWKHFPIPRGTMRVDSDNPDIIEIPFEFRRNMSFCDYSYFFSPGGAIEEGRYYKDPYHNRGRIEITQPESWNSLFFILQPKNFPGYLWLSLFDRERTGLFRIASNANGGSQSALAGNGGDTLITDLVKLDFPPSEGSDSLIEIGIEKTSESSIIIDGLELYRVPKSFEHSSNIDENYQICNYHLDDFIDPIDAYDQYGDNIYDELKYQYDTLVYVGDSTSWLKVEFSMKDLTYDNGQGGWLFSIDNSGGNIIVMDSVHRADARLDQKVSYKLIKPDSTEISVGSAPSRRYTSETVNNIVIPPSAMHVDSTDTSFWLKAEWEGIYILRGIRGIPTEKLDTAAVIDTMQLVSSYFEGSDISQEMGFDDSTTIIVRPGDSIFFKYLPLSEGEDTTYDYYMKIRGKITIDMMTLLPGWNLVSLPYEEDTSMSLTEIFEDSDSTIYRWDNDTRQFIDWGDSSNIPGYGYYVYVDDTSYVSCPGKPVEDLSMEVDNGWNLLGAPYICEQHRALALMDNYSPDSIIQHEKVWYYDPTIGNYRDTTGILFNTAFWAYTLEDTLLEYPDSVKYCDDTTMDYVRYWEEWNLLAKLPGIPGDNDGDLFVQFDNDTLIVIDRVTGDTIPNVLVYIIADSLEQHYTDKAGYLVDSRLSVNDSISLFMYKPGYRSLYLPHLGDHSERIDIAGGDVYIPGDIIILDTLMIGDGTNVLFAKNADANSSGSNIYNSELIIDGGHLICDGTVTDTVLFSTIEYADSSANQWYNLTIQNDGTCDINFARIEFASQAIIGTGAHTMELSDIDVRGDSEINIDFSSDTLEPIIQITNLYIEGETYIKGSGESSWIKNSTFSLENTSGTALEILDLRDQLEISGCTFENYNTAVNPWYNSDVLFENCTFDGGQIGLYISGTTTGDEVIQVDSCTFSDVGFGILSMLSNTTDLDLSWCVFDDCETGISLYYCPADCDINHCQFNGINNGDYGVFISDSDADVKMKNSTIDSCEVGVHLASGRFWAGDTISADSLAGNTIQNSSLYLVRNASTCDTAWCQHVDWGNEYGPDYADLSHGSDNPILYYPWDGTISHECENPHVHCVPCEFATIDSALTVAATDTVDTVYIHPGTYKERGMTVNKAVYIEGSGIDVSIIDGEDTSPRIFSSTSALASGDTVTLTNLTIKNGLDTGTGIWSDGGGAWEAEGIGGALDISYVKFESCSAKVRGGVLKLENAATTIDHCYFLNNRSLEQSGCIWADSKDYGLKITNTIFEGNAGRCGAALRTYNMDGVYVENCVFVSDTVNHPTSGAYGGAMFLDYAANSKIRYNTFYGNYIKNYGTVCLNRNSNNSELIGNIFYNSYPSGTGKDIYAYSSDFDLVYCNIDTSEFYLTAGSEVDTFVAIQNTNPFFVDAANGDFQLSDSSTMIDEVDDTITWGSAPEFDISGTARDSVPDIGAYEYPEGGYAKRATRVSQTRSKISIPTIAELNSPVPNPFNSTVSIDFDLTDDAYVRIHVHTIDGRIVTSLVNEKHSAGHWHSTWDGRDSQLNEVSSGVYLIKMEVFDSESKALIETQTKTATFVK